MKPEASGAAEAFLRAAAEEYSQQFPAGKVQAEEVRRRLVNAAGIQDRLARVRTLLALLCGEQTAARALNNSATRHDIDIHCAMTDEQWQLLLADLVALATELCGRPAANMLTEAAS